MLSGAFCGGFCERYPVKTASDGTVLKLGTEPYMLDPAGAASEFRNTHARFLALVFQSSVQGVDDVLLSHRDHVRAKSWTLGHT